jgi:hypothetical protein
MTLYELRIALEAYGDNAEKDLEMAALHAAWIINVWTEKGKSVTPQQLLGRDDSRVSIGSCEGVADFDAKMRAKQAELDKRSH